ncbi:MAG: Holliday junction branch migration protein RuvA [Patescibacteria group bacterium]
MIGSLRGIPKLLGKQLIIDVAGVGYAVNVGTSTLSQLLHKPTVELCIHTHVREDEISFYGFLSPSDQVLFEYLLSVSGIGPKSALHIADRGVEPITQAVQQADIGFFTQIPRVGKKLAQKIIIDLRSKLGTLKELDLKPESQQYADVVAALENFGYGTDEIYRALQHIDYDAMSIQSVIKLAIKQLSK